MLKDKNLLFYIVTDLKIIIDSSYFDLQLCVIWQSAIF